MVAFACSIPARCVSFKLAGCPAFCERLIFKLVGVDVVSERIQDCGSNVWRDLTGRHEVMVLGALAVFGGKLKLLALSLKPSRKIPRRRQRA